MWRKIISDLLLELTIRAHTLDCLSNCFKKFWRSSKILLLYPINKSFRLVVMMENLTESGISSSADRIETVACQVILEIISSAVLFTGAYLVYKEIEIRHPVYAVIFCDLLVSLVSSVISIAIFPFSIGTFRYTAASNLISLLCLHFHCCCWSILSVLRYLYINHQHWLDQTFPEFKGLLWISFSVLGILFTINITSLTGIAIYFGFPVIKFVDMSLQSKLVCLSVTMVNLMLMILASCWCYIKIMWQRGRIGHNSVHVQNNAAMVMVENANPDQRELEMQARIQNEATQQRQEAEVRSAVLSLKTNAMYVFILLTFLGFSTVSSTDILPLIFSLHKSLGPVITCVINFSKIRAIVVNSCSLF